VAVWTRAFESYFLNEVRSVPLVGSAQPSTVSRLDATATTLAGLAVGAGRRGAAVAFSPVPLDGRSPSRVLAQVSDGLGAGVRWGAPVVLSEPPPPDAARPAWAPQVAVDAEGNVLAAWIESDFSRGERGEPREGYVIRSRRLLRDSGRWEDPLTVASGPGYPGPLIFGISLAASAAGNAVLVWKTLDDRDTGTYTVRASQLSDSRWGTPEAIRTRNDYVSDPEVAMDDAGNAVAAWTEVDGIRAHIVAARFQVASGSSGTGR
jgi:hypothetical protein